MNGVKSHRNEQAINVHMATCRKLYRQGQSLKGPPFCPSKGPPIFPKKYFGSPREVFLCVIHGGPFEGSFFTRNAWWALGGNYFTRNAWWALRGKFLRVIHGGPFEGNFSRIMHSGPFEGSFTRNAW